MHPLDNIFNAIQLIHFSTTLCLLQNYGEPRWIPFKTTMRNSAFIYIRMIGRNDRAKRNGCSAQITYARYEQSRTTDFMNSFSSPQSLLTDVQLQPSFSAHWYYTRLCTLCSSRLIAFDCMRDIMVCNNVVFVCTAVAHWNGTGLWINRFKNECYCDTDKLVLILVLLFIFFLLFRFV